MHNYKLYEQPNNLYCIMHNNKFLHYNLTRQEVVSFFHGVYDIEILKTINRADNMKSAISGACYPNIEEIESICDECEYDLNEEEYKMFEQQSAELHNMGGTNYSHKQRRHSVNTCEVYEELKKMMARRCKTCKHKQYLDDYYICDLTNTEVKEADTCNRWEQ